MRRTQFLMLLVVILAALTLAACTSYRRYPYPDHREDRYYRYDSVRGLAYDLEVATERVYEVADDTSHHGSDREDYALDRLEDLRNEARDFNDEIDDRRPDPRDVEDEYRDLVDSYYRARDGLRALHGYDVVYREFDRVSRIMAQLNRIYGGRDHYGYRYR